MKKISMLILLSLLLVACGDEKTTVSTEEGSTTQEETNTSSESVEEENVVEEEKIANVEIEKQVSRAWKNSIGTVWVHSAAILKNTGETAVEIGETQMNYKGQDDSVLGTSTMIYSVPRIVKPGETAYVVEATILDGVQSENELKETTFNFSFDVTTEDANLMEVSSVKGIDGEYGYKVTGLVKNSSTEQQDDIRLAAALLDKDGNLLGILEGSVDVGLAPGNEAGFELSYPDLPEDVGSKVATIEVKSYGWTW